MCDLLVRPLCCVASAMDYVLERGVGGSKGGMMRPRSGSYHNRRIGKQRRKNQQDIDENVMMKPDHERYYYENRQRQIRQHQSRTMTSATTYTGTDDDGLFDDLSEPDSWIGDEIDIDFMNPTMVDDEETMTSNSASLLSREEASRARRARAARANNEFEESDSEFMYVDDEDNYAYHVNNDYETRQDSTLVPSNASSSMMNDNSTTLQSQGGADKTYEEDTAFESRVDEEEEDHYSSLNITRSDHDDSVDVVVRMMEQQARNEMKRPDFNSSQRLRAQGEQRKRELEAELFEDTVKKDTEEFFREFFSSANPYKSNEDTALFDVSDDTSKSTNLSTTKGDKSVVSVTDKSLSGGGNSSTISNGTSTKELPAQ